MKRLWLLVALILLSPAAAQSSGISATLHLQMAQPLHELEIMDDLREACDASLVRVAEHHFSFAETAQDQGCAEAVLRVPVDANAEVLELEFRANRMVTTAYKEGSVPVVNQANDFVQRLTVVDNGAGQTTTLEIFDRSAPAAAESQERSVRHTIGQGATELRITWLFDDTASPVDPGKSYSSQVRDVSVVVSGGRLPSFQHTLLDRAVAGGALDTVERIAWRIEPEHLVGWRPSAELHFDETPIPSAFATPLGPAPWIDLQATTADGQVVWWLGPEMMTTSGAYHLDLRRAQPLAADSALAPIAGTGMFLPILGATYASYQYHNTRQRAEQAGRRMHGAMRASLIGIAAMYVLVLLFLFISGEYWNLLISPLPVAGIGYFLTLVAIAAGFVLVAIMGARSQTRAIEQEVDELLETKSRLERSNHDLEHFAYIASHDLQEPLRTISGFSQLLDRRYGDELPDGAKRYLDKTIAGSQRMQQLIGDLLAYSRITTHGDITGTVDLGRIIDDEVEHLRTLVRESNARVHRAAMPTLPGDAPQLGQVFNNLIRNAIKYSRDGVAPEINIGATLDGRWWHITVQDNGVGIPKDQFDRIFVIFQRLAPRSDTSGTGIGLSIVHRVVERHGGKIWLDSEVGQGTTFHIRLPAGVPHD